MKYTHPFLLLLLLLPSALAIKIDAGVHMNVGNIVWNATTDWYPTKLEIGADYIMLNGSEKVQMQSFSAGFNNINKWNAYNDHNFTLRAEDNLISFMITVNSQSAAAIYNETIYTSQFRASSSPTDWIYRLMQIQYCPIDTGNIYIRRYYE
jgi:hypothetical protein